MRGAQQQATTAADTSGSTAAGYGSGAADISSVLTPFLTRELNNPGGFSQQDQTQMLSAAEGGAGGLAGGLATKANERAAATGNASGAGASLDDIAREREKAAAGASEGIATKNAETKIGQQEQAASGLKGLYGTDVSAQLGAMGVQNSNIGQEVNAGSHGWFQNMTNLIAAINKGGRSPGAAPTAPGAAPTGGGGMPSFSTGSGMVDGSPMPETMGDESLYQLPMGG